MDEDTLNDYLLQSDGDEYFGDIGPVNWEVPWGNRPRVVTFHILTADEERGLIRRLRDEEEDQKIIAEMQYRLCYALIAVDGKPLHFPEPKVPSGPPGFEEVVKDLEGVNPMDFLRNIAPPEFFAQKKEQGTSLGTKEAEFRRKLHWIGKREGTLIELLINAYNDASRSPMILLERNLQDPN